MVFRVVKLRFGKTLRPPLSDDAPPEGVCTADSKFQEAASLAAGRIDIARTASNAKETIPR
jgi:hypothetical protein